MRRDRRRVQAVNEQLTELRKTWITGLGTALKLGETKRGRAEAEKMAPEVGLQIAKS